MQLGMIGLGKMGANMARRLMAGGHSCVGFDVNASSVENLMSEGAQGAATLEELVALLQNRPVASFWGHTSTIHAANAILGIDVTPATARPPIQLSPDGLPSLDGIVFTECFALSPDYVPGFRPAIGEEVPAGKITGWQVLRILW